MMWYVTVAAALLAVFAAAFAVHEAGHWAAARLLGYPASVVLTPVGPATRWGSDTIRSSCRDRTVVAAAGPAASIALAVVAAVVEAPGVAVYTVNLRTLAVCSVLIGLPQLIPFGPTDATSVVRAFRLRAVVS